MALTLLSMAGLWTIARTQSFAAAPTSAETVVGSLSTLDYRWAVWPWALEAIESFAYTGTGLGTFRAVGPRLYPILVPPGNDFGHAHNQFLQVALDVGLPGLIAYASLLIVALMVGWRVAVASAERRPFVLALLAGLAGLHVYGLTDALALGAKPGLLFWMALGLMAATASVGISAERG